MRECEPWKNASEEEFDNAMEGMEKLVMNQLYQYTFSPAIATTLPKRPLTTDDLERDRVLSQRISLFSSWIQEKHLDIPVAEGSKGFIMFAQQELLKINHYKAPRDKLICVLNCCKVIYGLIRHLSAVGQKEREKEKEKLVDVESTEDEGDDSKPSTKTITGSADDFLPILIFTVIKSNPPHFISNLEFVQRFRNPAKLSSEAGYYLSSLYGAVSFIETMDYASLSGISKEEFEHELENAMAAQGLQDADGDAISRTSSSSSSSETTLSKITPPPNPNPMLMNHEPTSSGSATPLNLPNLPNISTLTRELRDLSVGEDAKRLLQKTGDAMKNPLNRIGRMFSEALDSFEGQQQGQTPVQGQGQGQALQGGVGTPSSRPSTPSLFPSNLAEETPAGTGSGAYADQAPIQTPYKPRVKRGASSSSPSPSPSLSSSPGAWGGWEDTPSRLGRSGTGPYTHSPLALGPSQQYPSNSHLQSQSHLGVGPPPRVQSLPPGGGSRPPSRAHTPSNSGSGSGLWSLFAGSGLVPERERERPQVPYGTHPNPQSNHSPTTPQSATSQGGSGALGGLNLNLNSLWGGSRSSTPQSAEFDHNFTNSLSPFSSSTAPPSSQYSQYSQYPYSASGYSTTTSEAEAEALAAQSEFERASAESLFYHQQHQYQLQQQQEQLQLQLLDQERQLGIDRTGTGAGISDGDRSRNRNRAEREARQNALETLTQMFPSVDSEVVGWVLEANDGDVGKSVEVLLEMGTEAGAGTTGESVIGGEGEVRGYDVDSRTGTTGPPHVVSVSAEESIPPPVSPVSKTVETGSTSASAATPTSSNTPQTPATTTHESSSESVQLEPVSTAAPNSGSIPSSSSTTDSDPPKDKDEINATVAKS